MHDSILRILTAPKNAHLILPAPRSLFHCPLPCGAGFEPCPLGTEGNRFLPSSRDQAQSVKFYFKSFFKRMLPTIV